MLLTHEVFLGGGGGGGEVLPIVGRHVQGDDTGLHAHVPGGGGGVNTYLYVWYACIYRILVHRKYTNLLIKIVKVETLINS